MTVNHGCGTCVHKRSDGNNGWVCPFVKVNKFVRDENGNLVGIMVERESIIPLSIVTFGDETYLDAMNRLSVNCHGDRYEHDGSEKICSTCGIGHNNTNDHCDKFEKTLTELRHARVASMKRRGIIG